jgi:DNA (cytosine-5)-methyltransferase 1
MSKPIKVLNLYAGIGGNRKLWENVEVTAVEINPEIAAVYQTLFPKDTVIVADAHQYLIDHYGEYDFIWASPPCPTHSKARFALGVHGKGYPAVYPDMRLYQEIILLKHHFTGKWCVENVMAYYRPLIEPQLVGRHWYWSNFSIEKIKVSPSGISQQNRRYRKEVGQTLSFNTAQHQTRLGIDLSPFKIKNKRLLLRNCVEPEVGLHIFEGAFQ